ncbi:MAG: hypothetical protein L3J59_16400 [Methylococcaceae bacterium]|nr:hypothetical protein [Methylococcaceae bacterium]
MNQRKEIVSLRLTNDDRTAVQSIADRLLVRESDIYRFAVNQLVTRLQKLLDSSCRGIDLLPLFLELREDLNYNLGFKKNQLYNIINHKELAPERQVSMEDIELLILPHHLVRNRLKTLHDINDNNIDTDKWLRLYFKEKYL